VHETTNQIKYLSNFYVPHTLSPIRMS